MILQEYCFKVPGTHITAGGSPYGICTPAAQDKLAKPDVPVVAIMGDGDFT